MCIRDRSIVRLSDSLEVFSYNDFIVDNWRPGTEFVRPKWGIYRSLNDASSLRDEEVLYNDFSITEIDPTSINENEFEGLSITNPVHSDLKIERIPPSVNNIQISNIEGKIFFQEQTFSQSTMVFNVDSIPQGIYAILFNSADGVYTKMIVKQ